ncbi:ABC transporter permease [Pedobacter sp. Leaf41]|jgi:phospholipid/cholesterol/gamma-HCH transport system substrate-binding protein|uniref:MlaD family protein n=1 Tax=Pedobacter sp. Leaf41 TaxID=1736218 RepID=UPI0007028DA6|nr:MlaD family protein [Pedobacter sp. Leaf41]KQN36377.1 ABC transporter permease [Pedobacter sp. Leaf41]RZK66452.1 MAG: MCE family protein [Pedobacter sp.]
MNDNKKKITVGIFIAIGILIFVFAIFTLGSQKKTFVKSFTLSVVFNDIQGLKKGNNVWFSGVKIGTIKKIEFFGTSQVRVFLSIEEDVHKYIHKDAGASIGADGLIGNKIVVITGGNPKFPFVEDGDVLKVNNSLSTDDIMKTLQVNNKNLVDVTGDFKILAHNLVDGKGAAGALLSDEKLAQDFKTMVANLNRITASTAQTAQSLNTFGKTLNTKNGLMDKMMTDTAVFAKLERSASTLQKTAQSASVMAANLEKASGKLNSNDNAAGLLLNDAKTADQVRAIMINLEKSSKKLDEDLEALQSNFLLRGFFKKRARDSVKNK